MIKISVFNFVAKSKPNQKIDSKKPLEIIGRVHELLIKSEKRVPLCLRKM